MWARLVFYLFLPIVQSCSKGKPNECLNANFAPGSNLAGEGYDVTKMQRKGAFVINTEIWRQKDKSCTICKNPYMDGEKQKLPISVVDWRPSQKCSIKISSSLYQSSEELVSSSMSSIENNWGLNLGINVHQNEGSFIMAGTNSKLAEYSMEKTKKDKFSFASQSISCAFYSYRVSHKPMLHPEFKRSVKELPKEYNTDFKQRFYKFINTYGTHYITKVTLGGSVHSVTSIKQCETTLQGLSADEVKICLDVEANASVLGKADMKAEIKHCNEDKDKTESKSSFSSRFNDRLTEVTGGHTTEPELLFSGGKDPSAYKEWLDSLPRYPDVISYSLDSLHELIPTKNPLRKHLRKAIHDYILEKSLWRNCSEPCKAGVKTNLKDPCVCICHNKPEITPDCCPSKRGLAQVRVTIVSAEGLWGDHTSATDAYVKVFDKNNHEVGRTDVIQNNNSPRWVETFDLGDVVLAENDKLRLEVWDEDSKWDDDLLGSCEVPMTAGQTENFCNLNHGVLFYKTEVTCGPSLSGPYCAKYVGSPMNFHLEKVYVSRNARPVPAEMLLNKGVLLDKLYLYQKTNYSAKSIL
ncbi:perforin-1-like [Myxocyprinus asiaticus]|uniref:perforin-1-like n=1 Tax=Myxocyprinus asiaticus TaxID=70543 RepID=UPI002222301B|nr:perforin-1-like [Myxocyprinus asiaticus]